MKRLLILFSFVCSTVFPQPLVTLPTGETSYNYHNICEGFCGPAAIGFCTDKDPVEIGKLMDWQHYHGTISVLREDLQDSPSSHKLALLKLGFRYIVRSSQDLISGKATPNKTIVLIHPDARSPYLAQHWVVLATPAANGNPRVHWGNGEIREIPDLLDQYKRGKPQCAYEIVPGPAGKATWQNRLWDWFFKKVA